MLAGPTQPTNTAEAAGTSGDQEHAPAYRGNELTKTQLLAVLAVLYSLNRNTTDRLPKQVQTIKHATPENYHLTKASHKRSQPTQQQQVGGEAPASARNSSCGKLKELQANGGSSSKSSSSSLHKRKPTHTHGSQNLSVRFLAQAKQQVV